MHFSAILAAGLLATVSAVPTKRDVDINAFLGEIASLFPVDVAINDICGALGDGENALGDIFGLSDEQDGGSCADVSLIYARGTCDPGNVGTLVGPPFFDAVQSAIGSKSLTVQGVPYAASVQGYLDADPAAGQMMAQMVGKTLSSCPNTEIVLSGYSQGGYAVHNAAAQLTSDQLSKVSSAVIFGDPLSHQAVKGIDASRVHIVCHAGDDICSQGFIIGLPHLTYAEDAASSASFVASKL